MARNIYEVEAPDGTKLTHSTRSDIVHHFAVIGLLRLRSALPKVNPDNPEEETRWDRHRRWIMIGTSETEKRAEALATGHGYASVQDEFRVLPVVATPSKGARPGAKPGDEEDDDEPGPFQAPTAPPEMAPRHVALPSDSERMMALLEAHQDTPANPDLKPLAQPMLAQTAVDLDDL